MNKLSPELLKTGNGVELKVVTDLETIKNAEVKRVDFYLRSYQHYKEMNYQSILRWPEGIDPERGYQNQKERVGESVVREVEENEELYRSFGVEYIEAFKELKTNNIDKVAANLYGYKPRGRYELLPTAYGTIASPFDVLDGVPMVFRLPEFTPKLGVFNTTKGRSKMEGLIHEIYAHALTAIYRTGTLIDDRLNIGTHANHKERLMDLLGRTLLVRSGLMKKEDVAMQNMGLGINGEVSKLVDSVYYASDEPDENNLRYDGSVEELFANVIQEINKI